MPTSVTPEFRVRAALQTTCPICGASVRVTYIQSRDEVEWKGGACPHLKPFDFHRHGQDGPLYAVFAEIATHPQK